jgi:ubiquitin
MLEARLRDKGYPSSVKVAQVCSTIHELEARLRDKGYPSSIQVAQVCSTMYELEASIYVQQ